MELTIEITVADGDEAKTAATGVYRPQIEFKCDVTCRVGRGLSERRWLGSDHGYPGEATEIEIVSVKVTSCIVYARPYFTIGREVSSIEPGMFAWLESHAAWCRERIETDHMNELAEKALSLAAA